MFRQIISNEKEVIAFYDNSGNTGILPYIYLLLKLLPNISQWKEKKWVTFITLEYSRKVL